METKDLILLIIMPIIFIGIVFYTSNYATITGAVTSKEAQSNVIGTYSIMPSFRAKIDYSLDDYKNLKVKLKNVIDICKSRKDAETCFREKATELNWNCAENEDKEVLHDFINKFKDCINLDVENIVCRFYFDERKLNSRIFEIKLTNWYYKRIKAELIENNKVLATEFINQNELLYIDNYNDRNNPGKRAESIVIQVEYKNNNPTVKKAVKEKDVSNQEIILNSAFLLYKANDGAKFIDKLVENNFRDEKVNKIVDLPKVKGMKFCAKSGKQIYIYNAIVYKFAVTFPKSAPKPIDDLEALDALKAENTDVLTWSKSSESDIKSYSIYYSKKDFINDKIEAIKKDKDINKISAMLENINEIEDIDLTNCNFEPVGEPCKYSKLNQNLERNKLYYWKSQNKFIYLIGTEDGVEHNFAVTAVNDDGDEIDNDKSIEGNTYVLSLNKNYRKFASSDDLAPNKVENLRLTQSKLVWNKPSKNMDGSKNSDLSSFKIYYKKSTSKIAPQLEAGYESKIVSVKDAQCEAISDCMYNIENIAGLEKGQNYNFAVTALDEKSNEFNANAEFVSVTI